MLNVPSAKCLAFADIGAFRFNVCDWVLACEVVEVTVRLISSRHFSASFKQCEGVKSEAKHTGITFGVNGRRK